MHHSFLKCLLPIYEWIFNMLGMRKFSGSVLNLRGYHRGKCSLENLKFISGGLFYLQDFDLLPRSIK